MQQYYKAEKTRLIAAFTLVIAFILIGLFMILLGNTDLFSGSKKLLGVNTSRDERSQSPESAPAR
jgi:hypothetical protein